jgi:hypothetical protein
MNKIIVLLFFLIIILSACESNKSYVISKWEDGSKRVEYIITKGTEDNPIDFEYFAYYRNGNVFKTGQVKNKKEEGVWKFYYLDNKIKSEGNFIEGVKEGDFITYYRTGEPEQKGKYKQGEVIELSVYNRDGTPISNQEIQKNLIIENTKDWTDEQLFEMKMECEMSLITLFENGADYCNCFIDSVSRFMNFDEFYYLTERELTVNPISQKQMDNCKSILELKQ